MRFGSSPSATPANRYSRASELKGRSDLCEYAAVLNRVRGVYLYGKLEHQHISICVGGESGHSRLLRESCKIHLAITVATARQ